MHGEFLLDSRTRCRNTAHALESTRLACRKELDCDWSLSRHETTIGDHLFLVQDHQRLCFMSPTACTGIISIKEGTPVCSLKILAVIPHWFFPDQTRSGSARSRATSCCTPHCQWKRASFPGLSSCSSETLGLYAFFYVCGHAQGLNPKSLNGTLKTVLCGSRQPAGHGRRRPEVSRATDPY